jgi:hypothetical protein
MTVRRPSEDIEAFARRRPRAGRIRASYFGGRPSAHGQSGNVGERRITLRRPSAQQHAGDASQCVGRGMLAMRTDALLIEGGRLLMRYQRRVSVSHLYT